MKGSRGITSSSSNDAALSKIEWDDNKASVKCYLCFAAWTLLNRRHHCRYCGRLVCDVCSSHRILLGSTAQAVNINSKVNVDSINKPQRVCDACFEILTKKNEVKSKIVQKKEKKDLLLMATSVISDCLFNIFFMDGSTITIDIDECTTIEEVVKQICYPIQLAMFEVIQDIRDPKQFKLLPPHLNLWDIFAQWKTKNLKYAKIVIPVYDFESTTAAKTHNPLSVLKRRFELSEHPKTSLGVVASEDMADMETKSIASGPLSTPLMRMSSRKTNESMTTPPPYDMTNTSLDSQTPLQDTPSQPSRSHELAVHQESKLMEAVSLIGRNGYSMDEISQTNRSGSYTSEGHNTSVEPLEMSSHKSRGDDSKYKTDLTSDRVMEALIESNQVIDTLQNMMKNEIGSLRKEVDQTKGQLNTIKTIHGQWIKEFEEYKQIYNTSNRMLTPISSCSSSQLDPGAKTSSIHPIFHLSDQLTNEEEDLLSLNELQFQTLVRSFMMGIKNIEKFCKKFDRVLRRGMGLSPQDKMTLDQYYTALKPYSIENMYYMSTALEDGYEFIITMTETWRVRMQRWIQSTMFQYSQLPVTAPDQLQMVIKCAVQEQIFEDANTQNFIRKLIENSLQSSIDTQSIQINDNVTKIISKSIRTLPLDDNKQNVDTPAMSSYNELDDSRSSIGGESTGRSGLLTNLFSSKTMRRYSLVSNFDNDSKLPSKKSMTSPGALTPSSSSKSTAAYPYNFEVMNQYMKNLINTLNYLMIDLVPVYPSEIDLKKMFRSQAYRIIKDDVVTIYYENKQNMLNTELMLLYHQMESFIQLNDKYMIEMSTSTLTEFMNEVWKQYNTCTNQWISETLSKLINGDDMTMSQQKCAEYLTIDQIKSEGISTAPLTAADIHSPKAAVTPSSSNKQQESYMTQWPIELHEVVKSQLHRIPADFTSQSKVIICSQLLKSLKGWIAFGNKQLQWLKSAAVMNSHTNFFSLSSSLASHSIEIDLTSEDTTMTTTNPSSESNGIMELKINSTFFHKACLFINNHTYFISQLSDTIEEWAYAIEDYFMEKISDKLGSTISVFDKCSGSGIDALSRIISLEIREIFKVGLFRSGWEQSPKALYTLQAVLRCYVRIILRYLNAATNILYMEIIKHFLIKMSESIVAVYIELLIFSHGNGFISNGLPLNKVTLNRLSEDLVMLTTFVEELRGVLLAIFPMKPTISMNTISNQVSGDSIPSSIPSETISEKNNNNNTNGLSPEYVSFARELENGSPVDNKKSSMKTTIQNRLQLFRKSSKTKAVSNKSPENVKADGKVEDTTLSVQSVASLEIIATNPPVSENEVKPATKTSNREYITLNFESKKKFELIMKPLRDIILALQMEDMFLPDFVKTEFSVDFGILCGVKLWQLIMIWKKGHTVDEIKMMFTHHFEDWLPYQKLLKKEVDNSSCILPINYILKLKLLEN